MPKSYPPEFRRKVLDLLAAGRSVTEVAEDLGISGACIYNWRKQDRIDRGELTAGQGVRVSHNAVEMLMHRAGLQGLPNRRRHRSKVQVATATDLVERSFARSEPDQLWVTDITEHRTREGKVYCSVVLDVFSRRIVGWSIDSSPTASLVTNALGMAIDSRRPAP